ncbi:MAG TPA: PQQ-dependent sugar dehydrogenase [Acidimicrobiia bacterium]|nr:PQQ-dependent sugar dehydrogenase [Acidimicrobiia bacterium]
MSTPPGRPPASPGPAPWWRGPNLPYLAAIVVSVAVLVPFVVLARPFAPTAPDDGGLTTTTSPGTAVGSTTTLPGSPVATTTTIPGATTSAPTLPPGTGALQGLDLEPLATGIPFPVFATALPGDDRIFVLERQGRVRLIDGAQGLLGTPYLNLVDRVGSGGIENGLLGMAFHPEFADNGRFYVYYTTATLNSRLSEFRADDFDDDTADASTERILLEVPQRGIRHRAGMLQFGPEGYLYVALGDGGMADRSAQELDVYQGKILRIDVDGGTPYAIPPDNPHAAGGGLGEIWAHGLRNPWRFHIDAAEGLIYIGDVGQSVWEEINVQPLTAAGLDYGWPDFEGEDCYKPVADCDLTGWVAPTLAYTHEEGCSVTGGYVYRGADLPELVGHYFYADWCNGWVRSFRYEGGEVTDEQDWSTDLDGAGQVASFGLDGDGELLVVDSNGSVFRVVPVRAQS